MSDLWSDIINEDTKREWVDGSYCDKLYKDTRTLRAELIQATLPIRKLCKGCLYAPFDRRFTQCMTCIKATKYETKPAVPLILWYRVSNKATYNSENGATDNGQHRAIKMMPANDNETYT